MNVTCTLKTMDDEPGSPDELRLRAADDYTIPVIRINILSQSRCVCCEVHFADLKNAVLALERGLQGMLKPDEVNPC